MNMQTPPYRLVGQSLLPFEAPLAMPVRGLEDVPALRRFEPPAPAAPSGRRTAAFGLAILAVIGLGLTMAAGLARDGYQAIDALLMALYLPIVSWTAFAAATAVLGSFWSGGDPRPSGAPRRGWVPQGRTAILIPARNEDVEALRDRIRALRADLGARALRRKVDIFVLSDSDNPLIIDREERMAEALAGDLRSGVATYYRRRRENSGRKPGNIAEWLRRWGGAYQYMLTFDADSRMSASRIAELIRRMEKRPDLGLIQSGVRLTGARTRFGRVQQAATGLYGPAFTAGIAGWSGGAGNYWGHNALARVRAFADAAGLPRLEGSAPFGGDVLSHDFVEAAWLRRAGWSVEIDPDAAGSSEEGPQTLAEFHKRDRRWCQGNLQHIRILARARGLDPISRLHLACGIFGYLASPLWLALVVAATMSGSTGTMTVPVLGAIALLLAQKLAGVAYWLRRDPAGWRRTCRVAAGETLISGLLAPIVMMRQTVSVISVLSGNDCGWKPAARSGLRGGNDDMPWLEPAAGVALLLAVLPGVGSLWQVAVVMPIVLPLLIAPWLVAWLDARPPAGARHAAAVGGAVQVLQR